MVSKVGDKDLVKQTCLRFCFQAPTTHLSNLERSVLQIFLPKSPVFSSFLNVYTSALFDLTTHAYLLKHFLPSSTPKRPKRCKRRQYVMHFSSPPISLVHKRNRKFWEQCIFRKIHLWKRFKILRFNRRIGAFKRGWQEKLHLKKFRFSTEMSRLRCSRGRTSAFCTTIISFYN